ncbi:MAG: VacJ family lipoprotein [Alphaproteobacteria bacterium]|nr:VacJ family lipoprotein [Alphaproteobacteria bacterium]
MRDTLRYLTLGTLCLGLSACAATTAQTGYNDPFEPVNRAVFEFNDVLDKAVAKPVAEGYVAVVPRPARKGVTNVLRTLRTPVNAANQLLQGDIEGFASDVTRGLVNVTFGVLGLVDVASAARLEYEQEDFGQTLAVWGVPHGPYVVLPVLGPNSLRDHTGMAIDAYADPLRLYLFNTEQEELYYGRLVMTGIDKRAELLDTLEDLRENSLDYYATLRSAHYQHRESLTRDQADNQSFVPEIPDYDDFE